MAILTSKSSYLSTSTSTAPSSSTSKSKLYPHSNSSSSSPSPSPSRTSLSSPSSSTSSPSHNTFLQTHKILSTIIFNGPYTQNQTPQKHHTIGRGTPGQGITPWMNSGDLRVLGGRRGKIDQVDPESLTSFC